MKGTAIFLDRQQADLLLSQFRETAAYRGWQFCAVAIMRNHVHMVVGVPGDPDAEDLVRDFKSYASRVLNRRHGKPAGGTWWSAGGGSRRKLSSEPAVTAALRYVCEQPHALVIWTAGESGEPGA
jgi:REP element-mobilizing transposase RayT